MRLTSIITKTLKWEIVFLSGWTLGGIYVAILLTCPKLLALASRML